MASEERLEYLRTPKRKVVNKRRGSSSSNRISSRKRKAISYKESSSDDEPEIDKVINATAAKNKLSQDNVKDILQNLVSNEQVLEACKLRAQEFNMHLDEQKQSLTDVLLAETPTGSKLTRKKARELNHPSLPDLTLNLPKLGNVESKGQSTENTDEDLDFLWSCSPYDHQDGIFKRPSPPTGSSGKKASSSRSKPSPAKPIVSKEPWLEFLNQFQTEDDETDPEYVATEAPGDSTDDEEVVITKKEKRSLWNEALDCFEETLNVVHPVEKETQIAIPIDRIASSPKKRKIGAAVKKVRPEWIEGKQEGEKEKTESSAPPPPPLPDVENPIPYSIIPHTSPSLTLPPLIPPAPGVESILMFNPTPVLLPKFNLVLGSDNNAYLLPQPEEEEKKKPLPVDPNPVPKSAFLKIDLNDDLSAIMSQIQSQKLVHNQEMEKESWVIDGWTKKGLRQYHQQLLTHIQFLGQMFVQTYSHPALWQEAKHHMTMLEDLQKEADKEKKWFIRELAWNLTDMLKICKDWETELTVENEENRNYVREIAEVNKKFVNGRRRRSFHDRLMERLVSHKAFLFVHHLPEQPALETGHKCYLNFRSMGQLTLCAMQMHHAGVDESHHRGFYKAYVQYKKKYRNEETLTRFWTRWHVSAEKKEFERTKGAWPKVSPPQLALTSYEEAKPMVDLPYIDLPYRWAKYCYSHKRFAAVHYPIVNEPKPAKEKPKLGPSRDAVVTYDNSKFKAQFKVPAKRPRKKTKEAKVTDKIFSGESQAGGSAKDKMLMKERGKKILQRFIQKELQKRKPNPGLTRIRNNKLMSRKLMQLLNRWDDEYDGNVDYLDENLRSTKIFYFIKEFDIFIRIFYERFQKRSEGSQEEKKPPVGSRLDTATKERLQAYFKSIRSNQGEERGSVSTSVGSLEKYQKDALFSFRFLKQIDTVSKTKYQELMVFLMAFPSTGGLSDLYEKLESLFLSSHADILTEFLTNLLPRHASAIGRFCEQALCKDSASFLLYLKSYMDKREENWKDIYKLLNGSLDENMIREQLADVLMSNPLLIQWLVQFEEAQTGSRIIFPGNLIDLVSSLEEESNKVYAMRLQVSDDEDDDDDGSDVIFVPNDDEEAEEVPTEAAKSLSTSAASWEDDDSEKWDEIGLRPGEMIPDPDSLSDYEGLSDSN